MSEESHQSSTCFRFFFLLARFEYPLLASEENEEDRGSFTACAAIRKHVQNLHIYPTHPPFSYTSRSLIRARTILTSGNQYKETNCACFLRALPKPAILLYNSIPHVIPDPLKSFHITETRTEFQTRDLIRETKILHQGGIKFTREFLKKHQVPGRSKFHQGGQNNPPGRVSPGLLHRGVFIKLTNGVHLCL